jgi:predicted metal-binding protein
MGTCKILASYRKYGRSSNLPHAMSKEEVAREEAREYEQAMITNAATSTDDDSEEHW